jgi:DNA-binding transcriptional regulator YiaG
MGASRGRAADRAQIAKHEAEVTRAAAYAPRPPQDRASQVAFGKRIGVPVDTVRDREQGKRAPQGPARAPLRIFDGAPEAAPSGPGAQVARMRGFAGPRCSSVGLRNRHSSCRFRSAGANTDSNGRMDQLTNRLMAEG